MNNFLRFQRAGLAISTATLCWISSSTKAANVAVINTHDALAGSLRQAIQDAGPGDTIVFQIPKSSPGYDSGTGVFTITLSSDALKVDKNLTIDGGGQKIVITATGSAHIGIFYIPAGNVTISGITMSNGVTSGNGAGIFNQGNLTVRGCTLLANHADSGDGGGAIWNANGASLTLENSTLANNQASVGNGGGILNQGMLIVRSTTIFGNHAGNPAHTTGDRGGGISNSGTARIQNSIIAGNDDQGNGTDNVSGTFTSDGYNLLGKNSSGHGFTATGDQVNATDAQVNLGPLQDNGGPTQTMAPQVGSLAIDQGKLSLDSNNQPIDTDQRGQSRPVDLPTANAIGGDGSDIGAVEVGPRQTGPTYVVTNLAEHIDPACTADDCTLLEAITAAYYSGNGPSTITFAPGLSGTIRNSQAEGLPVISPLTIVGPGARLLTIDGGAAARILRISKGAGAVNISGLSLINGKSPGSESGGACNNQANLTISDCSFVGNSSSANGGGIYNDGSGGAASLTLVNCTIFGNDAASGAGGGIFNAAYNGSTTTTLTNCTFGENFAQNGGAIYNDGTSSGNAALTITNCTFSSNGASSSGGGIFNDALNPSTTGTATVTLRNTLFSKGQGANLFNDSAAGGGGGTIVSEGNNLSSDAAGATGPDATTTGPAGFLNHAGDIRNTDPKLGSFGNNGGDTDTISLLADSPARDAGNDSTAPATDQRGFARVGVSDIGAYEFGAVAPTPTPTATPTATPVVTATPTATPTPTPTLGILNNISSRLQVGTGENVLFAGFTIQGTGSKQVFIRAAGPSLASVGVAGALANPQLELHNSNRDIIATNDDWQTTQIGGVITADQSADIQSSGFAPADPAESAIIATLPPGAYTAIVEGVGGGTGVGIVELYDLSQNNGANLTNISTRGFIQLGDSVLIGGFTVANQPVNVIVEAAGPSLRAIGVGNAMDDPQLELHDANGAIAANDDWQTTQIGGVITGDQSGAIQQSGLAPFNPAESALIARLSPGAYTAIMRGANNTSGVGVIAIYTLP